MYQEKIVTWKKQLIEYRCCGIHCGWSYPPPPATAIELYYVKCVISVHLKIGKKYFRSIKLTSVTGFKTLVI